jgi:hypothetical protein
MAKSKKDKVVVGKKSKKQFFDKAEKYFNCTDRERAAFEAGIKLGSIFHQYVGTPVSRVNVEGLEQAITGGVLIQPFIENVSVKIDREKLKNKHDEYDYDSLTGNMLNVQLTIKYRNSKAVAKLEYIKEIHYPLMYISSLK